VLLLLLLLQIQVLYDVTLSLLSLCLIGTENKGINILRNRAKNLPEQHGTTTQKAFVF